MVFKSACIPAPPPESDPAIVYTTLGGRTLGWNTAAVDNVPRRSTSVESSFGICLRLSMAAESVFPFSDAVSGIGIEKEWHVFGCIDVMAIIAMVTVVVIINIIMDGRDRSWIPYGQVK